MCLERFMYVFTCKSIMQQIILFEKHDYKCDKKIKIPYLRGKC